MQLIDTHAHLYLPEFDADREGIMARAKESGVEWILMPAIDSGTHAHLLKMEAQWLQCKSMMGLHPCSINETYTNELAVISSYLKQRSFIAVGEIGLDFYWDTTFKQQQYTAFETQIQWALDYNLPIVIHSRNALDECIAVVKNFPGVRGVFHCFSGTAEQAADIRFLGFFLGIGGVVTYKNAGLDKVMATMGLDGVVLETDAPYLAPVPYRGKRNESSYLPLVVRKLAESTMCSTTEVETITTQNARKLFKLP